MKEKEITRKDAIAYFKKKRHEYITKGLEVDSAEMQIIKLAIGALKKSEADFSARGYGYWKEFDDTLWECSECGELQYCCTNYCSNCGSVMNEKNKPKLINGTIIYIGEKYKP